MRLFLSGARIAFAVGCVNATVAAAQPPERALAVVNARVWTGDTLRPWADAVLARGERLEAVGSSAEVRKLAGDSARVIDAGGRLLLPGFIDSHVHFVDGGFRLSSVQLRDVRSKAEFIERIRAFAAKLPPGSWITGGDWDHTLWGGELPERGWIDSVSSRNPVWVNRLDGHMSLANSLALAAGAVTRDTPDIEGGTIVRDAGGVPAGVLKDNAMGLVNRVRPAPSAAQEDAALDAAMHYVASHGVTSVHNMGSWRDLATFERAREQNRLRTRIYAAVPLASWQRLRDTVASRGTGDHWLRWGMLKAFVDGSLGSRTAAFHDPFSNTPGDTGLFVTAPEVLYDWSAGADSAGLHLAIHAIGDRAIATQLDIFARVAAENGARDRRFRIEHAQHIAPADIARFNTLGVIASMQPYHAIDDGRWAEELIGPERIKTTYAFRGLLDAGAHVAFGSDWFVAPPTPLEGIYAAVTRRTLDDLNPAGWVPEQKIGVEQAIRAYTSEAAYASFEEDMKGTLERGKLADFVLIDRDIMRVPPETIGDARVLLTVIGGKVVHEITAETARADAAPH